MSQNSNIDQFAPFFEVINKNFKVLDRPSKEQFHFWYGNKKTVISLFKGMSFPSIEDQEKIGKIKADKLLVLCSSSEADKMFYGATILSLKSKEQAEMISFVVHPNHRHQEYGSRLMEATYKMSELLKLKTISLQYRTYWQSIAEWEQLLDKTGWSESKLLLYYFTLPDINTQFEKDWFKNAVISAPYSVEAWNESSFTQLKETLIREDWQGKVPATLNPFQMTKMVLPHSSLLLKKGDEVVGWLICHLLQKDIVQATTLYVHPDKAKGQGMALMAEASRRRKLGAQVIFMVEKHNKIMLNLVNKHFAGGKTNQYELLSRQKKIE
ncbi:GNAT family N-acetyltransferase [Portibacter lacus]|uniref:N-acetyltransferase domain-containing protein n=1 Tax=Portibacter lacus TaxID=1099794 RepID=A0AA37WDD5_9BACT|nr:GNAT family N-acetyltransferase [Portibacter lacus]GLR16783.1 hypothetical protein GCM10007940_13980 [Portibacter lacus]